MKKYDIDSFPAKVASRMTPQGTRFDKSVFNIIDNPSANRDIGEAKQTLRYFGYDVYFGFNVEENTIWVRVELPEERTFGNSQREKLEELLKTPEVLSRNPQMKKTYLKTLSNGRINEQESSQQYFTIDYKLKNFQDIDKIFEAFWFNLKPVIKSIYDSQ